MVQRLHEAGIEVILDVVYNHTAEGNQLGPTLSFRGLDNASYYVLADDPRYYFDTTGCGNNVNLRHPRVVQMVMDSLALLGRGLPRRRLPLRPRGDADPRPRRGRLQQPVPRRGHPGPGARQGEDDLRELGPRPVRLPGRRLPAGLGRVERPLPRRTSAPTSRATTTPSTTSPATCSARATSSTAAAGGPGRASTSSPPTTASRSPTSTPTTRSTTRRTARTTATATTTTARGTAASRARPTTRRSSRCATGCAASR